MFNYRRICTIHIISISFIVYSVFLFYDLYGLPQLPLLLILLETYDRYLIKVEQMPLLCTVFTESSTRTFLLHIVIMLF